MSTLSREELIQDLLANHDNWTICRIAELVLADLGLWGLTDEALAAVAEGIELFEDGVKRRRKMRLVKS